MRKRPKTTLSKAKTVYKPFGEAYIKELEIPATFNEYNFGI